MADDVENFQALQPVAGSVSIRRVDLVSMHTMVDVLEKGTMPEGHGAEAVTGANLGDMAIGVVGERGQRLRVDGKTLALLGPVMQPDQVRIVPYSVVEEFPNSFVEGFHFG